jgi:ATP-dependent RNA helicase RhlE
LTFETLGLSADLLKTVTEEGYTAPTPVQEAAIPLVLAGRDVLAAAQTGTGKTAAFTLPILDRLRPHANTSFSPARHPVRALILVPTRELAVQVDESVRTYGRTVPLRSTVVYGGMPMDPQIKELRSGIEILVATPGRLLDLVGQKVANLGQVEILVLDEADRMLDMGFLPDIQRIIELLPKQRQNLMFSATFSEDIRRLSGSILRDPATVEVAPRNQAAEMVQQLVYPVDRDRKEALLAHLIRSHDLHQVLVFTRTKLAASRLATRLDREGIDAVAIHSDRSQPERTRALAGFKSGEIRILVATDVAARGLDIEDLPVVVNFELPWNPRTTSTASAGRAEPAPRARPSAWCASTRWICCGASRRCSRRPSRGLSRRASCPIATRSRGPWACAAATPGCRPSTMRIASPSGAGPAVRAAAAAAGPRRGPTRTADACPVLVRRGSRPQP